MLIAVLALLGVDLIVIVALLAVVLGRKRWVARQAGAFRGAIRVSAGEIDGIGSTWRRGYGRWVRHVLVWTKSPFLFRNELVPADRMDGPRSARPDEVKRLGDRPVVVRFASGSAVVEVAAAATSRELLRAVDGQRADAAPAVTPPSGGAR